MFKLFFLLISSGPMVSLITVPLDYPLFLLFHRMAWFRFLIFVCRHFSASIIDSGLAVGGGGGDDVVRCFSAPQGWQNNAVLIEQAPRNPLETCGGDAILTIKSWLGPALAENQAK
jgi:hypothetical protein